MKLKTVRIENFRSFKDETIDLDDYTCLVGPNGAGKSAVLAALNVFFRNTASSSTNVATLSEEDFHHRNTELPVKITLTFTDLSGQAQEDFKHYYRQGQLTVLAKAIWDDDKQSAEVSQYGARLVMDDFAPFFVKIVEKAKVAELRAVYSEIRKKHSDLPDESTKANMEEALRVYEEGHPDLCVLKESSDEFYGWSKGTNLLGNYIQWVYIPAVKDASGEQEESSKTALGQLLTRTVRTKVDFSEQISGLKEKLETEYRQVIDKEQAALTKIGQSIEGRLRQWTTPSASLSLKWHYDPSKSVVVNEPSARVSVGEDDFIGDIARLGHGMQRSFIVAMLHELVSSDAEQQVTLLLGFEEPELYQHPPQAQHIANVLEELAMSAEANAQVIVSTHSPYFVSTKGFENIRRICKNQGEQCSSVRSTTYEALCQRMEEGTGDAHNSPSSLMARIEQIMQPSQRELYFSRVAIIVEGIEDIAFISTHLHLTGKWSRFRELGCHFVVGSGKTSLTRPLAIANELGIPAFVIFDADSQDEKKRKQHERDNSCILRLCGLKKFDAFPSETLWEDNATMWHSNIADVVREDFGAGWDAAADKARESCGFTESVKRKNSMLIAATLEELSSDKQSSATLDRLCEAILCFAERWPNNEQAAASE